MSFFVFFCNALSPLCRRFPRCIFGIVFFRYCTTCTVSTTPERMQVVCGSWIRWLVSRIRICVDKLGGGWERDNLQRTAKRYGDDGHGKGVGLRLLLLAAVIMSARSLPPQTNRQASNGTERRHGAKILAALRRVTVRSSIV